MQISDTSSFPLLQPLVIHINFLFTKILRVHLLVIILFSIGWLSGFLSILWVHNQSLLLSCLVGFPWFTYCILCLSMASTLLAHSRILNLIYLLGLTKIILSHYIQIYWSINFIIRKRKTCERFLKIVFMFTLHFEE